MKKIPIRERIRNALLEHGEGPGSPALKYHDLAIHVFPRDQFPRAWRYSSNGGPPGCYMALSSALSRHGFIDTYSRGEGRIVILPASMMKDPE